MKNFIILSLILCRFFTLNAQIDIKNRPLALLFGNYNLAVEMPLKGKWRFEAEPSLSSFRFQLQGVSSKSNGFGLLLAAKQTRNPTRLSNHGPYMRFSNNMNKVTDANNKFTETKLTALGLGYQGGRKYMFGESDFFFETNFGAGFNLISKQSKTGDLVPTTNFTNFNGLRRIDILIRLMLGYRINNTKKAE